MKVKVFASLKDHFDKEFEVGGPVDNMDELRTRLLEINPSAADILNSCRFAVKDAFIDNDYKLQEHDTVIILPPASGG